MHKQFQSEVLKGSEHSEDLGIDGMINIRTDLEEFRWNGVYWVRSDKDRDQWRALVNMLKLGHEDFIEGTINCTESHN
jgi:hypothetical protein